MLNDSGAVVLLERLAKVRLDDSLLGVRFKAGLLACLNGINDLIPSIGREWCKAVDKTPAREATNMDIGNRRSSV